MPLWSTLKRLVNSKAFWSLNALLLLVPLAARVSLPISWDVFFLFVAAWLLLAAGTVYSINVPDILKYDNFGDFVLAKGHPDYLTEQFQKGGWSIADSTDPEFRTAIENKGGDHQPNHKAYTTVYEKYNRTRPWARASIGSVVSVALLLVLIVNGYRFSIVVKHLESPMKSLNREHTIILPFDFSMNMRIGKPVIVVHDDGSGGTATSSGKLLSPDDAGYIAIELESGKVIHIPKSRVVSVSSDA